MTSSALGRMVFWEECRLSQDVTADVRWPSGTADKGAGAKAWRWETAPRACSVLLLKYNVSRARMEGDKGRAVERDQREE